MTSNGPAPSRRSVLTALAATGLGFVAACSDDHGSSDPTSSMESLPGPQRLRAEAEHLEPASYVKTYTVDSSGANGAHRTFAEAYRAVASDRQARIGTAAISQSNPWDWRRIQVAPGTYHESLKQIPPHTALVGTGRRPEDVHVWWDGADNTFESTGRSTYVRNLHLEHTGPQADAHAMRDSGPSGDVGLREHQIRTVVFDAVRFTSSHTASLGKCTNDMAPAAGVSLTFRGCVFDGPGQPQSVNLVTNSGKGSARSVITFLGCTVISNHEQHPDASLNESSAVPAAPFGAPDFAAGRGDAVIWAAGRWDVGRAAPVQGLIVLPYIDDVHQTNTAHPRRSTRYVLLNPGSVSGVTTVKMKGASTPTTSVPKEIRLPWHGLSPAEQNFFGAQPGRRSTRLTNGAREGTMGLKAGEVYWVAVSLGGRAVYARDVSLSPAQGKGMTQGVLGVTLALDHAGMPESDGNGQTTGRSRNDSPTTAPVEPRWFFPGQGQMWVGVTFDHDVTVAATKAAAGKSVRGVGGTAGTVPAPTSLQPVPAGTLVPHVEIRNELPAGMA